MKNANSNFIDFGHALGRSEMKKLMAGSGGSGNIYCSIGGGQWQCHLDTLTECTDACVDTSEALGVGCWGCAQFP